MTGERKSKDKEKLAIDPDIVRELARLLDETGLSEIEFERDGQRVRVARQAQPSAPAAFLINSRRACVWKHQGEPSAAEWADADGHALLAALAVGYEVVAAAFDASPLLVSSSAPSVSREIGSVSGFAVPVDRSLNTALRP